MEQLRYLLNSLAPARKASAAIAVPASTGSAGRCHAAIARHWLPATTTHFRMDDAALAAAGIGPGTIRLSVGLEDPQDLVDDLANALRASQKS